MGYPNVEDVRAGVVFGETNELTGTLTVPENQYVIASAGGDYYPPSVDDVRAGVPFGSMGNEVTGTMVGEAHRLFQIKSTVMVNVVGQIYGYPFTFTATWDGSEFNDTNGNRVYWGEGNWTVYDAGHEQGVSAAGDENDPTGITFDDSMGGITTVEWAEVEAEAHPNLTMPTAEQLQSGVQVGWDGNTITGTYECTGTGECDYPTETDVRTGTVYAEVQSSTVVVYTTPENPSNGDNGREFEETEPGIWVNTNPYDPNDVWRIEQQGENWRVIVPSDPNSWYADKTGGDDPTGTYTGSLGGLPHEWWVRRDD